MLTIRRSVSYRIITQAVQQDGQLLVGTLMPNADEFEPCTDRDQLQSVLDSQPAALLVFNQHADARALVDSLNTQENQVYIEIRQDTKGVLGLHATRRHKSGDETLELIYQ